MLENSQNSGEMKDCQDDKALSPQPQAAGEDDIDPELLALLDQVCESGTDALAALDQYLENTKPPEQQCVPFDAAASLAEFRRKHAVMFEMTEKRPAQPAPSPRGRRWGRRLVLVAAAIVVLNALCTVAFGRSAFDLVAQWGDQTFRFHKSDFQTSEDGNIIYYPGGTIEDRTGMDDAYDPKTYEPLPKETVKHDGVNPFIPKDPTAPIGSPENPTPVAIDAEPFGHFEDSDVSSMGLEKGDSTWDESHSVEQFRILNKTLPETVKAYDIHVKLFPIRIPKDFKQDYIEVVQDHYNGTIDFFGNYVSIDGEKEFAVMSSTLNGYENSSTVEKDDRPVEKYTKNGIDYYLMYNLERVNATAMVGDREILFWGDITVDEMKQIIDSVYEGV